MKNGKGILKFPSGQVYYGEWDDDNKHGVGIYRSESGMIYIGEYEEDKK